MKKMGKNGILLAAFCGLCLAALLVFQSEIRIQDWPLPLTVSRIIMIALLVSLVTGLILGCRRYSAWKKAEDERRKNEYGLQILRQAAQAAKAALRNESAGPSHAARAENAPAAGKTAARDSAREEENEMKQREYLSGQVSQPSVPLELPQERLDDVSFIEKTHHTTAGPWQQYDYLLASRAYGWDYMVSQADYMAQADLENIVTVTVAELANAKETELVSLYQANGNRIAVMQALAQERGQLAVGGMSRALGLCPVKIVWFNQTRVLRVFSIQDDEELMLRYAETMIRRSFGTPDSMKLAKPASGAEIP